MSIKLIPMNSILTNTSPSLGTGTGRSSRYCKISVPPVFSIRTPFMASGMEGEEENDIFAFAACENNEGDKAGDGGGERCERIARRRTVCRRERLFRGEIRTDEFMPFLASITLS